MHHSTYPLVRGSLSILALRRAAETVAKPAIRTLSAIAASTVATVWPTRQSPGSVLLATPFAASESYISLFPSGVPPRALLRPQLPDHRPSFGRCLAAPHAIHPSDSSGTRRWEASSYAQERACFRACPLGRGPTALHRVGPARWPPQGPSHRWGKTQVTCDGPQLGCVQCVCNSRSCAMVPAVLLSVGGEVGAVARAGNSSYLRQSSR